MTSRSRWITQRPTALLLCITIAAVCALGKLLWAGQRTGDLSASDATGTCLDRRVGHYHVVNMPLERVVDDLSRLTGQPIKVEWDMLDPAEASTRQARVTIDLDDATLYTAIQTAFGTARRPIRYGVSRGLLTLSSRVQKWDNIVQTYDVSDLVQSFSDQPDDEPSPPAYDFVPLGFAGAIPPGSLPSLAPEPASRSAHTCTPRERAMDDLALLASSVLVNNRLDGLIAPSVMRWGEGLVVVATEPQQRYLQRVMRVLRGMVAARARMAFDARSIGFGGEVVPPMFPSEASVIDERPQTRLYDVLFPLGQMKGIGPMGKIDVMSILAEVSDCVANSASCRGGFREWTFPVVECGGIIAVQASPQDHRIVSQLLTRLLSPKPSPPKASPAATADPLTNDDR